jgi:hypothetical protein
MFSPPAVMMSSLMRPVMDQKPSGSLSATSPLCSHPSLSIALSVCSCWLEKGRGGQTQHTKQADGRGEKKTKKGVKKGTRERGRCSHPDSNLTIGSGSLRPLLHGNDVID